MPRPIPAHQPHCLGCGAENPCGMGLRLEAEEERVRGNVTLDRRHEGAPGFAHGGAIATILDDALGSLLVVTRMPAVTVRLEIDYRRPAFIGRPYTVEAWIERREDRKLYFAGNLREEAGMVAEAHGLFLRVDVEHFLQGADRMAPSWRRDLEGTRSLPW